MTSKMDNPGFSTLAVAAGCEPEDHACWEVMPPISNSVIYKQIGPGKFKIYDYSRIGNPTRTALENGLTLLEGGRYSLTFSSGMGSIVAVVNLLSAGDHIVSTNDLYSGTMTYLTKVVNRMGIDTTFVDPTDINIISQAITINTKMIYLETITNPKLKVPDIRAIVALARNKTPDILVVVDNTFLTPFFAKPLELGADITLMSVSKYINGHHDVVMGALTVNRQDLYTKLKFLQTTLGAIPSPNDCYQIIRSLKTFPLRMEKHMENGLAVANYLVNHPRISNLMHPLLNSHPQHAIFKSQYRGHSGMITFDINGTEENAKVFLASLKVIVLATSLGGTLTTIGLPNLMNSTELDERFRNMRVVPNTFVRLSVGLEDEKDLIADLEQALQKAFL